MEFSKKSLFLSLASSLFLLLLIAGAISSGFPSVNDAFSRLRNAMTPAAGGGGPESSGTDLDQLVVHGGQLGEGGGGGGGRGCFQPACSGQP
ncbi:hypothetical protein MLD38_027216 [Melastoma candidum]|uniref:Uncharacterized protein n=1 Tax=Melastoma candidum TaxID=119954 RepID=A0ACB9P108_9MYRT|nr:hypothetical protein MLD38_027216 [Melastoma candidum]